VFVGEQASEQTENGTRWAFEFHQGAMGGVDWYEMRLLKGGEDLKDGEVDGFLKVVGL